MTAGHQALLLIKIGCELEKLYYTERRRPHTVPTAGSRRKRCTYQKHTTERLAEWIVPSLDESVSFIRFVYSLKELVVLKSDRCGSLFSLFLSLRLERTGTEIEEEMDISLLALLGKLRMGRDPLACFALFFLTLLLQFLTFFALFLGGFLSRDVGIGDRGTVAIILTSM